MIETHCHLCDSSYDADRDAAIARAFSSGVTKIIEIAETPAVWEKAFELTRKYDNIYCALGVHPNDADKFTGFPDLLTEKKVVAIGECGLDYHWKDVERKIQIDVFEKHISKALELKKPVSVHCREAAEDVFSVISGCPGLTGVIHCFSSSYEFAEKFMSLGFYLGIDGPVTFPSAKNLKEVVKTIPLEKILLETDSPYLTPQIFRGKRNEPSYLQYITSAIAEIKQIPSADVSKITTQNAHKLFRL